MTVDREYEAYSLRSVSITMEICPRTDPVSTTLYMRVFFSSDA